MKLLVIAVICAYIAFNMVIASVYSKDDMTQKFITGQNVVGMIASNIFYAPAWLLKLVRFVVVKFIK